MLGRIKEGAFITQDFGSGRWPATKSGADVDPDMEFECEWKGSFWDCRADGYGMLRSRGEAGEYGNGSIFVHECEGVIASSNVQAHRPAVAGPVQRGVRACNDKRKD